MAFEKPVVVIDNGSRYIKAGFSCDNAPVSIFRSVVGRPKYLSGRIGKEPYEVFVGDEAVQRENDFDLASPIYKGRVMNWDNMERIWHHIFYKELKVAPEDRSVIVAVSPLTTMDEKYKCCQVLFEVLNTPAVCVQPQCVLALYAAGVSTGLVVDLGFDSVDIDPIYEGGMITHAHMSTGIATKQILDHIEKMFAERQFNLTNVVLEDIIRKVCYVSKNAAIPRKKKDYERKYRLPSGNEIDVSSEAFAGTELMFQPQLVAGAEGGLQSDVSTSLPDAVIESASKCDEELRVELYDSVVTCGGLAALPGLNERLSLEIESITHRPVRIISVPEPYVLPWLGGAVFAGITEAQKIWVTRKQYEESGLKVVRTKFM